MSFNTLPDLKVKVLAEITVGDNPDLAVTDSQRVRGGGLSAATLAERDTIPPDLRKANVTKCWVEAEGKEYWLKGGITNAHWVVSMALNAAGLVTVPGSNGTSGSNGQSQTVYLESSVPSKLNKGMKSLAVVTDGQKLCNTAILEKPVGYVAVVLGGTLHTVGEDKSQEAYFSGDGGQTARAFGAIAVGDFCYFNPSKAFAVAADTSVEFHYDVLTQGASNTAGGNTNSPATPEFVFEQLTPLDHWVINHPFTAQLRPSVFFETLDGEEMEVDDRYPAPGRIEVFLDMPVAGRAYIG